MTSENDPRDAAIRHVRDGHVDAPIVNLDRKGLAALTRGVAITVTQMLAESHAVGRSSYTIAEVATRAGLSEGFVREAVRLGLLRVVRPGGRDLARVLPEDEALWLTGRREEDDEPAIGLSKKVVARNRVRAIVANIMRQDRRGL